jgi:hypothetical protein
MRPIRPAIIHRDDAPFPLQYTPLFFLLVVCASLSDQNRGPDLKGNGARVPKGQNPNAFLLGVNEGHVAGLRININPESRFSARQTV